MRTHVTKEEFYSIKVGRNEPCPCGSTNTLQVFIVGEKEPKLVKIAKKYKKCCLGKHLFFTDEVANKLGLKKEND